MFIPFYYTKEKIELIEQSLGLQVWFSVIITGLFPTSIPKSTFCFVNCWDTIAVIYSFFFNVWQIPLHFNLNNWLTIMFSLFLLSIPAFIITVHKSWNPAEVHMVKLLLGVSHTRFSFCLFLLSHVSRILLCKMIHEYFIKHSSHQFKLVIQTFAMFLRKNSFTPWPYFLQFYISFSQLVSFKKLF